MRIPTNFVLKTLMILPIEAYIFQGAPVNDPFNKIEWMIVFILEGISNGLH